MPYFFDLLPMLHNVAKLACCEPAMCKRAINLSCCKPGLGSNGAKWTQNKHSQL